MKVIAIIACFLFLAFDVSADDCIVVPEPLAKEIASHLEKIRAGEYCAATILQSNEKTTIVIFTAEGPCFNQVTERPGSCGNNWLSYMVGSVNGKVFSPIKVGGKGGLSIRSVKIIENKVELSGLSIGKNDGLCCPSVPTTTTLEIPQGGVSVANP
jgi:hypothetical protein